MADNYLYYGDNLDVLRKHIKDNSVDLIYLDPPFNSQANYNILFKEASIPTDATATGGGEKSKAQVQAFTDSWTWNPDTEKTFGYLTTNKEVPAKISELIVALEKLLGKNSMSAYLVMMTVRLIELRRVLKESGVLYLHCDPTASHYLKIVLDAVFGEENFRNEIVWCYAGGGIPKKDFPNKHDIIFRYSKDGAYFYQPEYREYSKGTVKVGGGRHSLTSGGNALDLERGTPINDWWADLPKLTSYQKEWLGYATQKPLGLLERIVKTSSKDGDVILDPFCGCGTTIDAVEKINAETHSNRKWIGIDITHLAINLIKRRIADKYHKLPNVDFEVIGEPKDLKGAEDLAQNDRYQFEWWALSLVDARPINDKKKGSDRGIDGIIYLLDPNSQTTKTVLVQVKSGHVKSGDIRDFKGTLEREKAKFGIFITLEEPTKDMKEEAITYGFEESPLDHEQIQKIQILTIKELLEGVRPKVLFVNISYKKAEKNKEKKLKPTIIKKHGKYKKLSE